MALIIPGIGGTYLDLEGYARQMYRNKVPKEKILEDLTSMAGSHAKAEAILTEIINTEKVTDTFISELCGFISSGFTAEHTGLGCRGEGDFFLHRKLAQLISEQDSIINPLDQDDGGVVQVGEDYIVASVDGMHSRLSHFPFLAGFHATRAAIRDTLVMGVEPKALLSDIHLANDGDVAKIFDYTAGIATVSELTKIPLIAGSTLRIGGDLVLGDRLTGCVGCVGFGRKLTPRRDVKAGDVLVMTEGHGGGTIATTALYNGYPEVVKETLNLKNINLAQKLIRSPELKNIHSLTDVTNGGIRGDAFEIAKTANVQIQLFEDKFYDLVNPKVLDLLAKLEIDPMGVSIDSLLIVLPEAHVENIMRFIQGNGIKVDIIGTVNSNGDEPRQGESTTENQKSFGVQLLRKSKNQHGNQKYNLTEVEKVLKANKASAEQAFEPQELMPNYREEPYTPIKKVSNVTPENQDLVNSAVESAMKISLNKKDKLKTWMTSKGRI